MAFCKNCGNNLPDDAVFCTNCGASQNQQAPQQPQQAAPPTYAQQPVYAQPKPVDPEMKNNKIMGVISYFSFLFLVPTFAGKGSKFARFHAKQGALLFIFYTAYQILAGIVNGVVGGISGFIAVASRGDGYYGLSNLYSSFTGGITFSTVVSGILGLGTIFFVVLGVIGAVNALQGKEKELPVLGKMTFLDKFYNGLD